MENIILNTGATMPAVGLGVYQVPPGPDTERAVLAALNAGYRHIDTAAYYRNERDVGNAIRKSGIPREEIFVTTKLQPSRFFGIENAFEKNLSELGFDYVDLFLIHIPTVRRRGIWKALEKIHASGRAKAIGVSNFTKRDLEIILKGAKIIPAVNQVEFHPWLYRKELLDFCNEKGIKLVAYSPLARGKRLDDPRIMTIAQKYGKSPAQILLRWAVQHGLAVIPKTTNEGRMRENADIFNFALAVEDMTTLDNLNENYHSAVLSRLVYRE